MTLYIILGVALVLCICLSAFCSASEMSYSSCNPVRLERLWEDEGNRRAGIAYKITQNFDDALSAILISNNLANIGASSISSVIVISLLGESFNWLSTLCITILVIIFGETMPKITAKKYANTLALAFALPVRFMMLLLLPLVWLTVWLINILTGAKKNPKPEEDTDEAVEELQSIIETAENEAVLDEERSELLHAAIDFADFSAYEVMTARVDICAIDIEDDYEDIIKIAMESPYTRLPVYEGSIDNIIGVLYLNHFLKALTDGVEVNIRALLMPPLFLYKTLKLPEVLNRLRHAKQHLAIVSDEYGGVQGVVSMEDVLEQIVGDIWDESDEVYEEVVEKSEGEYELDGDMILSDFCALLKIDEDSLGAESETIGGWTLERFAAYPAVGDSFEFEGFILTVLEINGRRVEKVLIKALSDDVKNEI